MITLDATIVSCTCVWRLAVAAVVVGRHVFTGATFSIARTVRIKATSAPALPTPGATPRKPLRSHGHADAGFSAAK